jgi:hypothetical protein
MHAAVVSEGRLAIDDYGTSPPTGAPRRYDIWSSTPVRGTAEHRGAEAELTDGTVVRPVRGRFPAALPVGSCVRTGSGLVHTVKELTRERRVLWRSADGLLLESVVVQSCPPRIVADGVTQGVLDGGIAALGWRQVFDPFWRLVELRVVDHAGGVGGLEPMRITVDDDGVWWWDNQRQLALDTRGATFAAWPGSAFSHTPILAHLLRRSVLPQRVDILWITPGSLSVSVASRTYRRMDRARFSVAQVGRDRLSAEFEVDENLLLRVGGGFEAVDPGEGRGVQTRRAPGSPER